MANPEHVEIIGQGVEAWNEWTNNNPGVRPSLAEADLAGANLAHAELSGALLIDSDLSKADMTGANLNDTNLSGAKLHGTVLREAKLRRATLFETDLLEADLSNADLSSAYLGSANLNLTVLHKACLCGASLYSSRMFYADLSDADLAATDLRYAQLIGAKIEQARFSGAKVYGASVWDTEGSPKDQTGILITRPLEAVVTVDDLKVAQFIYLLLNNKEIQDAIDTITSKVVLILGRFTKERKAVLDGVRDELRRHDLLPAMFDFKPAENQDITDTITLLARMARFVIADLTDPMSVQQELTLIAPQVMVAIQPIILAGQKPWAMFGDLQRRSPGLLPVSEYRDLDDLLTRLESAVIEPAEAKRTELLPVIAAEAT